MLICCLRSQRSGSWSRVLGQVLKHSGREEQAYLASLAGLVLVLFWVLPYISQLFESIKELFAL